MQEKDSGLDVFALLAGVILGYAWFAIWQAVSNHAQLERERIQQEQEHIYTSRGRKLYIETDGTNDNNVISFKPIA